MTDPCRADRRYSLLGHVVEGCRLTDSAAHLTMVRYLVEGCGADIWASLWMYKTFIKLGPAKVPMSIAFLPLHSAAYRGALAMLRFFIEECQMPVDTIVGEMKLTPLHAACMTPGDERDVLYVVRYLVMEKGADITLRTGVGKIAADLVRMSGKQQILKILTQREKKDAKDRAALERGVGQSLLPLPPLPQGPDVGQLFKLAIKGDDAAVRSSIEHSENKAYYGTAHGKFLMRLIASVAAENNRRVITTYLCERQGVPVNELPAGGEQWEVPRGLWAGELPVSRITPLIGAILAKHKDLALYLLTLPDQEDLDLNRRIENDETLLHVCVEFRMARLAQELIRRGADMELWDDGGHTPLCEAAWYARLSLLRFFLQRYQARGATEFQRALTHPCRKDGQEVSLMDTSYWAANQIQ